MSIKNTSPLNFVRARHAFIAKGMHFLRISWVNAYLHFKATTPYTKHTLKSFSLHCLETAHKQLRPPDPRTELLLSRQRSLLAYPEPMDVESAPLGVVWCARVKSVHKLYCRVCNIRTFYVCSCNVPLCSDLCCFTTHNPAVAIEMK